MSILWLKFGYVNANVYLKKVLYTWTNSSENYVTPVKTCEQIEVPVDEDSAALQYPQRYGMGFSMTILPFGLAYGHGGSNGDFTCTFEIYKEHDMGFVIFTNSDTGTAFHRQMQKFLIYGKDTASFNVKL